MNIDQKAKERQGIWNNPDTKDFAQMFSIAKSLGTSVNQLRKKLNGRKKNHKIVKPKKNGRDEFVRKQRKVR